MAKTCFRCTKILLAFLLVFVWVSSLTWSQEGIVNFGPDRWVMTNAKIVDHLGRKALQGIAFVKDVEFENGVIEVDMAMAGPGVRSYPSINFRIQPNGSWERFYIRPHRSGLYADVLQYVPAFNRVDSWQLYNGFGFTAPAVIPFNKWFHVKIEVSGTRARVFLDDSKKPALLIHDLKHGLSKGTIGLMGPQDGTAFFSNFSYRADPNLQFDAAPPMDNVPGIIRDWQISKPFKALKIDLEKTPEEQKLADLAWQNVIAEANGLVDISRYHPRSGEPDCVFARTSIYPDRKEVRKIDFGYSDVINVFLNEKIVFSGNSAYQFRDSSFLGIAGYFDSVSLPLRKGENELLLSIVEFSGGWGFMCRDGKDVYSAPGVAKKWETPRELSIPESAAFDPARACIYVSNYDGTNPSFDEGKQFITKVTLEGKIQTLQWISGLKNATGIFVFHDKLYVTERQSMVEIDIPKAQMVKRYPVPGSVALNDLTVAPDGTIYISDSGKGAIFKFAAGQFEEWLNGPDVLRPNGVHVHKGKLIVGTNADNCLKSVDLTTKEIRVIANLGSGIIDGIKTDSAGNILVSHNEGRLFRVAPDGKITKILDSSVVGTNIADFDYVPEKSLVIFPTFTDNRVMAYELNEKIKSGYVDAGRCRIYYEEQGSGRPLILIHGGGLDKRMWDGQFDEFANRFRVIRYDARNHGLSRGEPEPFSHFEDLSRLMDGLGISKAAIMGLSMGGYVAIDFALAHPERVTALIPVSPGLTGYEFKDKEVLDNEKKINAAKELGEAVEYIMRSWTDGPRRSPGEVDSRVREKARQMYLDTYKNWRPGGSEERSNPPAIGRLSEIHAPTLVVVGDLDMPGILEIAERIEKNVAGARKVTIRGAAHLVSMEKPLEFNKIILDFLAKIKH